MPSLRSIAGLVLMGLLIIQPGYAQESDVCPYKKGRTIGNLEAELTDHRAWIKKSGWQNPKIFGKADFCNADLSYARLEGANLSYARLEGADLSHARLEGTNLIKADLKRASLFQVYLMGADLSGANLTGADLSGANLTRADLSRAILEGADLRRANLTKVVLFNSYLKGATLAGANLTGADLSGANLTGADLYTANLERAILIGANLEEADLSAANLIRANLANANLKRAALIQTDFTETKINGANLSETFYQPATAPAQGYLSGLIGLQSVRFCPGENSGLVQLRTGLKAAGLRDLERQATYALESVLTHYQLNRWNPIDGKFCGVFEGNRSAYISGMLRFVFFELTTGYGLYYFQSIYTLIFLVFLFSVPYMSVVIDPTRQRSGIWIAWPKHPTRPGREKEREIRLVAKGLAVVRWSLYFSLLSAFRIGWRDFNVQSWLTQLQLREYTLRPRGWVRVVSGVQSLVSVYLLALSVLTYIGRPFE